MAKYLENENESPEVDLKNLTVKLAGMGLDEEIDQVIPGKKKKKKGASEKTDAEDTDASENVSEEAEVEEAAEDPEVDDAVEDILAKASDMEEKSFEVKENIEEEAEELSDEVNEFYEKRHAERDLSLEKVEELAEEISDKKQKVGLDTVIPKKEKVQEEKKEKKKAKLDAFAITGIVLAVLALIGGIFYIYRSVYQEPNLGLSEREFRVKYFETPIYKGIINYGFTLPEPTYRDQEEETSATDASVSETTAETTAAAETTVDPTAVTTAIKSKYRYFDSSCSNALYLPIYITGCECKSNNYMKRIRFFAPFETQEDLDVIIVAYAGFLQAFTGYDSQTCVDKLKDAFNQSTASADPAVAVVDGKIAYALSQNTIDGVLCYVLDFVPAKEASKYEYVNSIFG
ncbi:MAG: hypothetical protein IKZ90_07290 [Clostridiales bacterium]|nr:hypothetical protein [Clostridiales bacterium]